MQRLENGDSFEPTTSGSNATRPCRFLTADQLAARNAAEAPFIEQLGVDLDPGIPARVRAARADNPFISLSDALKSHTIPPFVLNEVDVVSKV